MQLIYYQATGWAGLHVNGNDEEEYNPFKSVKNHVFATDKLQQNLLDVSLVEASKQHDSNISCVLILQLMS